MNCVYTSSSSASKDEEANTEEILKQKVRRYLQTLAGFDFQEYLVAYKDLRDSVGMGE